MMKKMRYYQSLLFLLPTLLQAQLTSRTRDFSGDQSPGKKGGDERQKAVYVKSLPTIAVLSTNTEPVGLYEKFEAILLLGDASYENPYDPEEIDVRATFRSPTGKTWEIFAFYDDFDSRDQWKVRFSPNEIGTWHYTLRATDVKGTGRSEEYDFESVASDYHGWLEVSPDNPHYLIHDDGTSFYGVGPAYPWRVNDGPDGLAWLEASGANMFYYWNIMYDTGGSIIESISSGLGRYDQPKCGRIDQVLAWSEARGLKVMLSIWPHDLLCDAISGWVQRWDQNPYNQICDVKEFYGSEEAWSYQEKQYRYLIARWGYSRSLEIWEMVCEINGTDGWLYGNRADALSWLRKVYDFFHRSDPYGRPVTVSQSGGLYWPDGYYIVDLPNVHLYETGWPAHFANDPLRSSMWIYGDVARQLGQDFNKPGIFGEAGYFDNYGNFSAGSNEYITMYHNALWTTWANGLAAAPLWWDFGTKTIFTPELMAQMHAFAKIVHTIDYAHLPLKQASIAVPQCDAYAMNTDSVGFGWIRDIEGIDVSNRLFTLAGLADGRYAVTWIDPWMADTVKTNVRISKGNQLVDQLPQLAQSIPDMAFIIRPAENGDVPQRLKLIAYPTELYSDSSFTSQITCFILDAQGRICTLTDNSVTFTLEGPGTLEGANPAMAADGVADVVFRANSSAGTSQIIASSPGLVSDTLNILVRKFLHIDDFEEYAGNAELVNAWQKRRGTNAEVFLESAVIGGGHSSMRLEYGIGNGSLSYAGISKNIVGDWSEANSLTFWLKPNKSRHSLNIRLYEEGSDYWYHDYLLDGSDSMTVAISLDDFEANYNATYLDRTLIQKIEFNVYRGDGAWGNGTLYFDNIKFSPDHLTSIVREHARQLPVTSVLYPNYPNPFNSSTHIIYQLAKPGDVRLAIYDVLGREIKTLVDEREDTGDYLVVWDGRNNFGNFVSTGVYLVKLKTDDYQNVRKILLMK
jgi:hypothetical protein